MIYKSGNLLEADEQIIVHQVNCQGVMGAGLAKAIRNKWPQVYDKYRRICTEYTPESLLGKVLPVTVGDKIILNVFGQLNYGREGVQTSYEALELALRKIESKYMFQKIAFPLNMGCGLAGGNWDIVSAMIDKIFGSNAIVYILDKK